MHAEPAGLVAMSLVLFGMVAGLWVMLLLVTGARSLGVLLGLGRSGARGALVLVGVGRERRGFIGPMRTWWSLRTLPLFVWLVLPTRPLAFRRRVHATVLGGLGTLAGTLLATALTFALFGPPAEMAPSSPGAIVSLIGLLVAIVVFAPLLPLAALFGLVPTGVEPTLVTVTVTESDAVVAGVKVAALLTTAVGCALAGIQLTPFLTLRGSVGGALRDVLVGRPSAALADGLWSLAAMLYVVTGVWLILRFAG